MPNIRKRPFIAQTQLGFAPMTGGDQQSQIQATQNNGMP